MAFRLDTDKSTDTAHRAVGGEMGTVLDLRPKNDARQHGEEWSWSVWLDGSGDLLDRVESVRYVLHSTFPEPIQIVEDRASQFRLEDRGWGEFSILAKVVFKDGSEIDLEHRLTLGESAPTRSGTKERRPSIFISHSATDQLLASALRGELEVRGIDVITQEDMTPGSSLVEGIAEELSRSQTIAFLVSDELRGFAEEELSFAQRFNRNIAPVPVGKSDRAPAVLTNYQALDLRSPDQVGGVADILAEQAMAASDFD